MKIIGIICEYNPFHNGHRKQFSLIRSKHQDCAIVCLMSGNYVQRGMPAIMDKQVRAKVAINCGADLVLELPVTASLSSAEGFASEGVRLLSNFCDYLSFGTETPDSQSISNTAQALLCDTFSIKLKKYLTDGISFPAARQKALEEMGYDSSIIQSPNNILAVEYCKAIISQNSKMKPEPLLRNGDFHSQIPDKENPSATSIRILMENNKCCTEFIPHDAKIEYENAVIHKLSSAERAILYRLQTMSEQDYASVPFGSEGLCWKLMKNARNYGSLDEIISNTKSKRYTRTRIDRMIMCAFLGLTQEDLCAPSPYARVLAFNDKGRDVLRNARQYGFYPNIGQKIEHPYQEIENRCDDLYGLFSVDKIDNLGSTVNRRVYYKKSP